jgi:uncharacterized protein (UPF0335 family)
MVGGALRPAPPEWESMIVDIQGTSADRLRSIVERIERLEEEKTALGADVRDVYSEAKGAGFDTKVLRQIIRLRKMDQADRREQEEILDVYKRALDL